MKNLLFLICMLFAPLCYGQLFDNWRFGNYAGIRFTPNTVQVLNTSAMYILEGCASVADQNGDILFYTNGLNVWNRNDQLMPMGTGLKGDNSSTQSALIVPWPGHRNKYFIFTATQQGMSPGLQYSIVDMRKNNGLGDVDSKIKNIKILAPISEKLAAVQHANDTSIWLITKHFGSDAFYAYLISPNGINTVPVISNAGVVVGVNSSPSSAIGYLRVSADGKRLANVHFQINVAEVFDFNDSTGVVSNAQTLGTSFNGFGPYGVEFSPNSRYVYVSENYSSIYQYDLQAANIAASRVVVATCPNNREFGCVQRGPDNKIYVARGGQNYLSRINAPDSAGTLCAFKDTAIVLAPNNNATSRKSLYGLPPQVEGFVPFIGFSFDNTCYGDTTQFYTESLFFDSVAWYFNDPLSGIHNYSTTTDPKHFFASIGSYDVRYISYYKGIADTVIQTVIINTYSIEILGATEACDGNAILLSSSDTIPKLLWSDGSISRKLAVTASGKYWLEANYSGCLVYDTIEVDFVSYPKSILGPDTNMCVGEVLHLNAAQPNVTYLWSTGDTSASIQIHTTGQYWLKSSTKSCDFFDTINVAFFNHPVVDLGTYGTMCEGDSILLSAANLGVKYNWSTGQQDSAIWVKESGTYWATAQISGCTDSDTVSLVFAPNPTVYLGPDISICAKDFVTLDADNPGFKYLWSTGDTTQTVLANAEGTYWVVVKTEFCETYDEVEISHKICEPVVQMPNIFSPNGDGKNDTYTPVRLDYVAHQDFTVFNRWGSVIFKGQNIAWDGNSLDGNAAADGVYFWTLMYKDMFGADHFLQGTVTVVR